MHSLLLFTESFPHMGGEPFLETEIGFLSKNFDEILVFPLKGDRSNKLLVPNNVNCKYVDDDGTNSKSIKKLFFSYPKIFIWWPIIEFLKSPHRLKYITQWNWNMNRFIGLIKKADQLKEKLKGKDNRNTVYYTYWFNDWASILALAKDMGLKGRVVTRAHGYDFDENQQARGYHPFRYCEWKRMDRVVQVSEFGKQYQLRQFPGSQKLFVSKLGVLEAGGNPIVVSGPFHIVSCSNFAALKRVPLIAEILKELKLQFHWTHIGGGEGMQEVQEIISKILPPDTYTFTGAMSNHEVIKYYANSSIDLFMNASNLEGLPVSLMEAISFGIPITGFNICGIPEIVNDSTGVLLNDNRNILEAADKLCNFLELKARDIDFRKGVKQFWFNNFNAEKNYQEFINKHLISN